MPGGICCPSEMKRHGLNGRSLRVTDGAIREIITGYTRESGVRLLQRELASVCRKAAMELVTTETKRVTVNGDNLEHFLGIRRYHPDEAGSHPQVGLVNGLAWTSVGGDPAGGGGERGAWLRQGGADRQPGGRDEGVLPLRPSPISAPAPVS